MSAKTPSVIVRKRKKRIIMIAITLLLAFLIAWFASSVVLPLVTNIAESKARAETLNAINTAAQKLRNFAAFHQSFFTYEKNKDGEIVLVSANSSSINQLYIMAQSEMQRSLNSLAESVIRVPLGAFTGITSLSGMGPAINIRYSAVGTSEALWNSYFYNEGINQTMHRVILRITTTVKMLIPVRASNFTITTDILISEDIVIGRVPEFYLSGITKSNMYDLLP
jgi:sporulation protein YunB